MKKKLVVLIMILLYTNIAWATVVMDSGSIKKAQEYGMMRYQESFFAFAKQWIVFEEKSKTVDEQGERLYVYTPFYLVAINARERLLAGQTINVHDGQIVLDAYKDSLPISVVFYIQDLSEIKENLTATLVQGDKKITAFDFSVQDAVVVQTKVVREPLPAQITTKTPEENKDQQEKQDDPKDKAPKDKKESTKVATAFVEKTVPALYKVQIFFYFDARQIDFNTQASLIVKPNTELERKFNFSFAQMD